MAHAHDLSEPWQAQRRGQGWFLLLIGVVVFALFGAVVGYAYMRGLPGIGGEPPVIRAAEGPYRTAPADRGGLAVPNAKSNIVTVLRPQNEPPRVERLLPAERAAPLESPEPETVDEPPVAVLSVPESAAPPTPAAAPTAEPTVAPEDAGTAVTGAPFPRSRPAPPEPVAEVAPEQPTISALPQIEPAAAPPAAVVPEPPAPPPAPPAAQAEPRPQPAATPPNPTQDTGNGELQRLVRTAPTTLATVRPAAGGGIYRLQLAAVRSEGGLTQAWADLRQRYPVALGGVNPQVERTDTTSGPLFRLQAGPFGSREAAADACSTIRGSGGQCFIIGPIAQ